ncbi:MAG TPA: methyltransferase domain-containing protein [Trebonia sp.]|nr:methyltransferase domain-containing protein [Trebonia sp.]
MRRSSRPRSAQPAQRAGLPAGGRALDAGCGPLGALAVLRDMVGEGGQVVGIDASTASLSAARSVLSRLGAAEVTLVAGDINTVALAAVGGPASFDLVFSRLIENVGNLVCRRSSTSARTPGRWSTRSPRARRSRSSTR